MNQAIKFCIELAKVRIDDSGFKKSPEWDVLVETATASAVEVQEDLPWQTGSHDSNRVLTFSDGSKLEISNPRQSAFGGYANIVRSV